VGSPHATNLALAFKPGDSIQKIDQSRQRRKRHPITESRRQFSKYVEIKPALAAPGSNFLKDRIPQGRISRLLDTAVDEQNTYPWNHEFSENSPVRRSLGMDRLGYNAGTFR
jgi:hypothetical protein